MDAGYPLASRDGSNTPRESRAHRTRGEEDAAARWEVSPRPRRTAASVEPDYIERNRAAWDAWAPGYLASGRQAWENVDLRWGIWGVLESELQLLSGIEGGHDAIELGCGTAEISAWLARRGARPVAVDLSSRQIRNVETLQREYQLSFPLVVGNAEAVHYEDASFDVAISEYGASLWCDPQRWLPEAYRLLRPGAVLIFITNSDFLMVCTPPGGGQAADRLMRDFFSHVSNGVRGRRPGRVPSYARELDPASPRRRGSWSRA